MGALTPKTMSQAAQYGGTPNDPKKPILYNDDGTYSTEKTITIESDGAHIVIPTIVSGKDVGTEEAIRLWRQGKNLAVGRFKTAKEAEAYAQKRHLEEERLRKTEAAKKRGK